MTPAGAIAPVAKSDASVVAAEHFVLRVQGVRKSFGTMSVLEDIDFSVREGEFVSLVGPSGCGKTTLLTILAALSPPDAGSIVFGDRAIEAPPPGIAIVFQDYSRSLFPWRRNLENVLLGMHRDRQTGRKEKRERAASLLTRVGLAGYENFFPWQVSGGMQQRVAIARALATEPRLLLLDEPLAAVDAQTRSELQDLILSLAREGNQACVLVTHDVEEAIYMAHRLLVLGRRPTSVREEVTVELPWPRDQLTTREAPRFLAIRHHVLSLVRSAGEKGALEQHD
jgi:NitT/TauT family transport system ATP-binding protein